MQPTNSIQHSCEPDENQVWSLYFDGSKSKEGAGVGCIIIDPVGNKTLLACRLEFECTNNVAEYEALLQGLRKALDMRIQNLMVFGDYEIVVRQMVYPQTHSPWSYCFDHPFLTILPIGGYLMMIIKSSTFCIWKRPSKAL